MALICSTCGNSNADGMRFCERCASLLPMPHTAKTPPPPPLPGTGQYQPPQQPGGPYAPPDYGRPQNPVSANQPSQGYSVAPQSNPNQYSQSYNNPPLANQPSQPYGNPSFANQASQPYNNPPVNQPSQSYANNQPYNPPPMSAPNQPPRPNPKISPYDQQFVPPSDYRRPAAPQGGPPQFPAPPPTQVQSWQQPAPVGQQSQYVPHQTQDLPPEDATSVAPKISPNNCYLMVTRGGQVGQEFPLHAGSNEIGRWDENNGFFPHIDLEKQDVEGYVHRSHAVLRWQDNLWLLEDRGGTNGTRLRHNGQIIKLTPRQIMPVSVGDELIIGRVIMRLATR